MSQNGKGSRQRPKSVDQKTWDSNYLKIFGKRVYGKLNKRSKKSKK